jgi:hypothetical protein
MVSNERPQLPTRAAMIRQRMPGIVLDMEYAELFEPAQ